MRIRRQLVSLLVAVLLPALALTGYAVWQLLQLQRDAQLARYEERVSALRLALDTEIDGSVRAMRTLAEMPVVREGGPSLEDRMRRLLASNPMWSEVGLLGADGARGPHASTVAAMPPPPPAVLEGLRRAPDRPWVSDLVATADGRQLSYLAVALRDAGDASALRGALYVAVAGERWHGFLRRMALPDQATLTLSDSRGVIVARTRDHERWAGQPTTAGFRARTQVDEQGRFASAGAADGRRIQGAFSRLHSAPWVLSTAVPQSEVDAALWTRAAATVAVVLVGYALALVVAALFSQRVARSMGALERYARAAAESGGAAAPPKDPLPLEEAETVRRTMHDTVQRLAAREAGLQQSVEAQAHARAEAERLSLAKDELLAMLGHELRNPLNALSTASAVLARSEPGSDNERRAREIVQRQTAHLSTIVNGMLDTARLNAGKVRLQCTPLDAAEVVGQVVEAFRAGGRCTHLTLECELQRAPVFADATRLEQVVSNLLDNACKYTPAGGTVRVSLAPDAGEAVLTVRDTGSGISESLRPQLFEVFSQDRLTVDRAQGGLGLGLAVVRRLVELHGGSVDVHSDGEGRGATFVVRLPLHAQATPAEPAPAAPAEPVAPLRIALVEDNPDSRDAMSALLRLQGHEVVTAADGERGLELISVMPLDLALIDIGLPGMDGLELAGRLRGLPLPPTLRLVALTGYGSGVDRARAMAAGFDAFLVKPLELPALEQCLRGLEAARAQARRAAEPARG